ncbi:beta-lactamase regulator AmpE [Pseudocolwellia agarivorans]|uniref:beta-lactamase regulator AmpE n=1 Tax=Pseudocolwellia agarivorans TaxID=1911682 RepID=UPI00098731AB|nr:beta-lactamase regulator AmpE [Pseudocolwellia agarivorans]
MSLISLLIALLSERYLSNKWWQFNTYYKRYSKLALNDIKGDSKDKSPIILLLFLLVPTVLCYIVLTQLNNDFLYLIASTVILIICFGCLDTRSIYKRYLVAAFRGETTTCDLIHKELLQNKQLPEMGFGQALVWLNYRYFIAIMLFFVIFGAPGALFYRLLTSINERCVTVNSEQEAPNVCVSNQLLFIIDWLPVRIIALGYMLVGHFSKAIPIWLGNLFDLEMPSYEALVSVAQKSEDFMVDSQDCTAEPCTLVRLAKRTLLLCLAFISILILTGVL